MKDYITEAFKALEDLDVEVVDKKEIAPVETSTALVDNDINAKLIAKIEKIAKEIARIQKEEHIGDVDAELIKQDIIRDCGLMGGTMDVDTLDVKNNPFDRATKEMHDLGPVDNQLAFDTIMNVSPEEFARMVVMGIKAQRGLLPGPQARRPMLDGPRGRAPRQLPHGRFRR